MTTLSTSTAMLHLNAHDIPYVTADESFQLLQVALERLIKLLETLDPQDWAKPTACTAWNVRDMVAHQAGGYASGASYREMIRQYSAKPGPGQLPEDAVNVLQVSERANRTPAELIAELRQAGPLAARNWAYHFRLARWVGIPHPVPGWLWLGHLFRVIHSRDTWMHRLDICRATNRPFEQTAEHDGRITALVMRDAAQKMLPYLKGEAMLFDLTGVAGGRWQVGQGQPAATVRMDVLDFNIFASGRYTLPEALAKAEVSGSTALAEAALKNLLVLY